MNIPVRWLTSAISAILIIVILSCSIGSLRAAPQDTVRSVIGSPNNQFRVINTFPEYWVDGKPFLMHGAAFFYHRIPRDRWAEVFCA